jgi:hypothetical protein
VQCLSAAILDGGLPLEELLPLEAAENATEIAAVEPKLAADLRRRRRILVSALPGGDLVQHPGFGERECAVEMTAIEHADAARVEAVESANGGDARIERCGVCSGLHARPRGARRRRISAR